MTNKEDKKIVFGTPKTPSEKLIEQLPKKEQKRVKKFTPCLYQSNVTLGFRWICTKRKYHKSAHNEVRIPRIVDPPHPEKKPNPRLFD